MNKGRSELKTLMLRAPALTLAAAESMTCGRVQARAGEISGASDFFLGGITAYALEQKVAHLGVNRAAARKVNGVSAAVAEEMARGACELFGSDLSVATTGYAEPNATLKIAEPFAWWAIAHRRRPFGRLGSTRLTAGRAGGKFVVVRSGRVECPGATRTDAQAFVADAVMAELIAYLRELRCR
ncbi:MAG: CinA family protein [Opitutaceae bacterium]|nr:CinA family protein [Opitutaceae bacterium]